MAIAKKKTKAGPIVFYSLLCVALLAFLTATIVFSWLNGSDLIKDPVFLGAVQSYLGKYPRLIKQEDLDGITYMNIEDGKIYFDEENSEAEEITSDLSDFAADLQLLHGLKSFKSSSYTYTADLSVLTNAPALEVVTLDGAKETDFSPLAKLPALKTLSINNVTVTDTAFLADLKGLEVLRITNTGISDLSQINAEGLKELTAGSNGITALEALGAFTTLEKLDLSGNADITDLTPLSVLKNLTWLSLDDDGGVVELAPLASLAELTDLNLCGTGATDVTPILGLTKLSSLDVTGLELADWSVFDTLKETCTITGLPEEEEAEEEEATEESGESEDTENQTEENNG